jgi:hypothetical protein
VESKRKKGERKRKKYESKSDVPVRVARGGKFGKGGGINIIFRAKYRP